MSPLAIILAAVGPLLLRFGWQRQRGPVIAGWLALGAAAALLTATNGAWGLAVGATASMAMGLLILAHAAWTAPAGRAAATRERQRIERPRLPLRLIGRRVLVFVLVVPGGLLASAFLGWAAQHASVTAGWDLANATALALLLAPIAWALMTTWQMLQRSPLRMAIAPVLAAGLGMLLWLTN